MTTPSEALRTILPIAGWGDTQAADVTYTGGADPVLPTPFRIGTAGAATLAAAGLAATEMWQVRTGRRQLIFAKPRRWRGPFPPIATVPTWLQLDPCRGLLRQPPFQDPRETPGWSSQRSRPWHLSQGLTRKRMSVRTPSETE